MKSTTYPNANPRDGFKRVQANNNCCTFQTEMVSLSLNFPYERQIFNLLNQLSIISVISTLQPGLNCISVIKESPYLKFSCESNSIDLSSVFPLSRRIQSNLSILSMIAATSAQSQICMSAMVKYPPFLYHINQIFENASLLNVVTNS